MSARLWTAVAVGVLLLCGCDGNVLVGFGPDTGTAGGGMSGNGGSGGNQAQDASVKPTPNDAAISVSGPDGSKDVPDTGPKIDAAIDDGGAELPLPIVTWATGAHAGNDYQEYVDYGTWRGRALDLAAVYPERADWDGFVMPGWPVDMFAPFAGRLLLSVPLYPVDMGNNQDCASGAYDDHWKMLGTFLVDRDRGDSILRLGWGFNDTEHAWRADADPADWIECFRKVVSAVRSTDPEIGIDWSFNPTGEPTIAEGDPYAAYPGDDYVDYVGQEAFDKFPPTRDEAGWDQKCNSPTGLCKLAEFARAHHKKLGIGEWGGAACGEDPGGDNPFFIQRMVRFFGENADVVGYEAYFEQTDENCSALKDAEALKAEAAQYQEAYGPR